MSCMNIEREPIQTENIKLLMEILNYKIKLRDMYRKTGPGNSDYITLSIKLDLLIKEYIEERLLLLISIPDKEIFSDLEA